MSSWGWTYNLGQNKMEQQTPIHPLHSPPKKSFPIFDLGERGGLGLPFILSKIVAWYFNISLEGVLFSTVAANVLQVSQFNWSLPLFTHISQGEGRGRPIILSHYSYTCTLQESLRLSSMKTLNQPTKNIITASTNKQFSITTLLLTSLWTFSPVSDFFYCILYTCPL